MSSTLHAELSSIADTVSTLRDRVARLAQPLRTSERDDLVSALYEAERSLLACTRHLERSKRLTRT
jgi:hypothetical protein